MRHLNVEWPPYVPRETAAPEALAFVVAWLDSGKWSEDMLAASALTQMEPLVDWHWAELTDELLGLMSTRWDVCRVVQGSMFAPDVPDEVQAMLYRAAEHGPVRNRSARDRP
jgi:hypothetical protein